MNFQMIIIIISVIFNFLFLILSGFLGFKYVMYKTKTPADVFLKAKKGLIDCVFSADGKLEFRPSDSKKYILNTKGLRIPAPYSTFHEPKSHAHVVASYECSNTQKSVAPEFVALSTEINRVMNEKNCTKEEATKFVKENNRLGLNFDHIVDYLDYDDTAGTYMAANDLSLERTSMDKPLIKYIFLIIMGAIAVAGVVFVIAFAFKWLTQGNVEVVVNSAEILQGLANKTMENATILRP